MPVDRDPVACPDAGPTSADPPHRPLELGLADRGPVRSEHRRQPLTGVLPVDAGVQLVADPERRPPARRLGPTDGRIGLRRPTGPPVDHEAADAVGIGDLQWEEDDVPPAVVFEILSPGNTVREMLAKLGFYDRHGVGEFYLVDSDIETLQVSVREGNALREIPFEGTFVSPRLGIRFERIEARLVLSHPDGQPFATFAALLAERDAMAVERDTAVAERDTAVAERDALADRAARLAEQLRALGIEPDRG